jgi:uncharacterized protein
MRLARGVATLIVDHHLLRCREGMSWLAHLADQTNHEVLCAADFMRYPRRLLEARRAQLYRELPVPEGWHAAYARGESDTHAYQSYCRRCH